MRWTDNLTAQERKHLREMNMRTKRAALATFAYHAAKRTENDDNPVHEPCWTCRRIACKMGAPITIDRTALESMLRQPVKGE